MECGSRFRLSKLNGLVYQAVFGEGLVGSDVIARLFYDVGHWTAASTIEVQGRPGRPEQVAAAGVSPYDSAGRLGAVQRHDDRVPQLLRDGSQHTGREQNAELQAQPNVCRSTVDPVMPGRRRKEEVVRGGDMDILTRSYNRYALWVTEPG